MIPLADLMRLDVFCQLLQIILRISRVGCVNIVYKIVVVVCRSIVFCPLRRTSAKSPKQQRQRGTSDQCVCQSLRLKPTWHLQSPCVGKGERSQW